MMGKEEKRLIETPQGAPKEMTFEEWLQSAGTALPDGFREWIMAEPLWYHGKEIGWAISKFNKYLEFHN